VKRQADEELAVSEELQVSKCPVGRDDRKTAVFVDRHLTDLAGAEMVRSYAQSRDILRNGNLKQAGSGAEFVDMSDIDQVIMFYLDGEPHRQRRATVARFFSAKAIETRYKQVIEDHSRALLAGMQRDGSAKLDDIGYYLAVAVVCEILGLDYSDLIALSHRIEKLLADSGTNPVRPPNDPAVVHFYERDVAPIIAARRESRKDDVISHLIDAGYSDATIFTEVLSYVVGGMLTTREFIVIAAWHMFGSEELRRRFMDGDKKKQIDILEEILRVEPITARVVRRDPDGEEWGKVFAIDIRSANLDEAATGPCPHAIDPDRADRMRQEGAMMSFGDGVHRCPGAQLTLNETRIFLDLLFRVPGIRLAREPEIGWFAPNLAYELRGAVVVCDLAA
jgi:cytochrome P450